MARLLFITGASSGLGQALAWRFYQAGYSLALVARRTDATAAWAASRQLAPDRYRIYQADVSLIDSMVAVIDPEMTRHAQRWGGSYNNWKQNVQKMRNFISQRCTLLDDGMTSCFDLTGPYDVTLLVEPPGAGDIDFNTLSIKQFPWTGAYFGEMENKIEANKNTTLPFLRWESRSGSAITPNVNTDKAAITFTQADTLVAVFGFASSTWEPGNGLSLSVNPTLVSDQVRVDYTLPESMPVYIALYALTGQKMLDLTAEGGAGQHTATLNLVDNNLAAGVYLLDFQAGGNRKSVKLTVVK